MTTEEIINDLHQQWKTDMPKQKATPKPNPIALGEELADYLRTKRNKFNIRTQGVFTERIDSDRVMDYMEQIWETNFWRAKALGVTPP